MDLTPLLEDYIRAQPNRALGGVRALSGFEYQIRSYLADFAKALVDGTSLANEGEGFVNAMEALSDHTRRVPQSSSRSSRISASDRVDRRGIRARRSA